MLIWLPSNKRAAQIIPIFLSYFIESCAGTHIETCPKRYEVNVYLNIMQSQVLEQLKHSWLTHEKYQYVVCAC